MTETIIRIPQQIGPVLRGFRRDKGLTQAALGQRTGIPQTDISSIELNPGPVSFERISRLVGALDLEIVLRPRPKAQKAAW